MKINFSSCVVIFFLFIFICFYGCFNSYQTHVLGETFMLENPLPLNYANIENTILDTLNEGDVVEVLNISYGKDFKVYKIKFNTKVGYVFSGDSVKFKN
jgi:hypothetical protein